MFGINVSFPCYIAWCLVLRQASGFWTLQFIGTTMCAQLVHGLVHFLSGQLSSAIQIHFASLRGFSHFESHRDVSIDCDFEKGVQARF